MADSKNKIFKPINRSLEFNKKIEERDNAKNKAEQEFESKTYKEQVDLEADRKKNELNRIRDTNLKLLETDSAEFEALLTHYNEHNKLKNDNSEYYTAKSEEEFFKIHSKREALIADNLRKLNEKLIISSYKLENDLAGINFKYDTEEEKHVIDYHKELQKNYHDYASQMQSINGDMQKYLNTAYHIYFQDRRNSIDYNSQLGNRKSIWNLTEDSFAISALQTKMAAQLRMGDQEGAKETSNQLAIVQANRGSPVPHDFMDRFDLTRLDTWLDGASSIFRIMADSSGEMAQQLAASIATALVLGPIAGKARAGIGATKIFRNIVKRLQSLKSKVPKTDFTTINKINQAILRMKQGEKDAIGIASAVLGARAIGSKVARGAYRSLPMLAGIGYVAETRSADFAHQRYQKGLESDINVTESDRIAGLGYAALNALGVSASISPLRGISDKILQAVNKGTITNGNKLLNYIAKELLPAAGIEGITESGQTVIEKLQELDPNSFDIDYIFSGDKKKLTPKQIEDTLHEVIVSGFLGAMAGGGMKLTLGSVAPKIKNVFNNVSKVFDPNKNSAQYLNRDTITDVFKRDADKFFANLSDTFKDVDISKKEIKRLTTSLARGIQSSQETMLSFVQDKNIPLDLLKNLFKKINKFEEINYDNFTESEVELISFLRKNPESLEGFQTASLRNAIVQELAKNYEYMKIAEERNLLENISTMSREELRNNFSFLKDDLAKQIDLYDLNFKNNNQTNTNNTQSVNQTENTESSNQTNNTLTINDFGENIDVQRSQNEFEERAKKINNLYQGENVTTQGQTKANKETKKNTKKRKKATVKTINENVVETEEGKGRTTYSYSRTKKYKGRNAKNTKGKKSQGKFTTNRNGSEEARNQLRMHRPISSSKVTTQTSNTNAFIALDPSQKLDKLKSLSLDQLLELKQDPEISLVELDRIIDDMINLKIDELKAKRIIRNREEAINKSLIEEVDKNGNVIKDKDGNPVKKRRKLDQDLLETEEKEGLEERTKIGEKFHPQKVFNKQIKIALRLDPNKKTTLEEVKQALSKMPLIQDKKLSEESLNEYAKDLYDVLENNIMYIIPRDSNDTNSMSDKTYGRYKEWYVDKGALGNALFYIQELFEFDNLTNFRKSEFSFKTKFQDQQNEKVASTYRNALDNMIDEVKHLLDTKSIKDNAGQIDELLKKVNQLENDHIEIISAILASIDFLKKQDEVKNSDRIAQLLNGLRRYYQAIDEVRAYTPKQNETLEEYTNRLTNKVRSFFLKVKKFFMSRIFGIIKDNHLDEDMFNKLKLVNMSLNILYERSHNAFSIMNKTNTEFNVFYDEDNDLNVNVNAYELYNIENAWEYVSKTFGINNAMIGAVIRKIATTKGDKYNYTKQLREFLGLPENSQISEEAMKNIINNKGLFFKVAIISYLQNLMQHQGGMVHYYQFKADISNPDVKPDYSVKVIPFYTIIDNVAQNMNTLLNTDEVKSDQRLHMSSLATEFSARIFAEISVKEVHKDIENENLIYRINTDYEINTTDNLIRNANFFKPINTKETKTNTKETKTNKEKHAYIAIHSSMLDGNNQDILEVRNELNALFNKDIKKDRLSVALYKVIGKNGVINFYNGMPFTMSFYTQKAIYKYLDGIKIVEIDEKGYNEIINMDFGYKLSKESIISKNSVISILTNTGKKYFLVNNLEDFIDPKLLENYRVGDAYIDKVGPAKQQGGINGQLRTHLSNLKDLIHIYLALEDRLGKPEEVPILQDIFYKIHKQTSVSRVYTINGFNSQTNKLLRGFYSSALYDNLRIFEKELNPNKEQITLGYYKNDKFIEVGKINPIQSIYHLINSLFDIETDDYTKGKSLESEKAGINGKKVAKDIYRSLIKGKNLLDPKDAEILRKRANEIIENIRLAESPIISLANAQAILDMLDEKFEGEKDKHRFINFLKDTYIKEDGKTTGFATKMMITNTMDTEGSGKSSGILTDPNQDIEGDNYKNFGKLLLPLAQYANVQDNFFLGMLKFLVNSDTKEFRDRFKKYTQPLMYEGGIVPALHNLFDSIGNDYVLSNIFKEKSNFVQYIDNTIKKASDLNDNFKKDIETIINNDDQLKNIDEESRKILINKINEITDYIAEKYKNNEELNLDRVFDIYYERLYHSFVKDQSKIIAYSFLPYKRVTSNEPNIPLNEFNELADQIYNSIIGNNGAKSQKINPIVKGKYSTKDDIAIKDMLVQPLYINRQFNNRVVVPYIRNLFFNELKKLSESKLNDKEKLRALDELFTKMTIINGDFFNNPVKNETDIDFAKDVAKVLNLDLKQVSFIVEQVIVDKDKKTKYPFNRTGTPLATNRALSTVAPLLEQTMESMAMYNTVKAVRWGFSEQVYDGIIINPMFAEIAANTWNKSFGDLNNFNAFEMYISLFDSVRNTNNQLHDFIFNNEDNIVDIRDNESRYKELADFARDNLTQDTLQYIYQLFRYFRQINEAKGIAVKNMSTQFTEAYELVFDENEANAKHKQISDNIEALISIYEEVRPDRNEIIIPHDYTANIEFKNVDELGVPIPMTLHNFKVLQEFFKDDNNNIDDIKDIVKLNDLRFEGYKPFIGIIPEIAIQLDTNFNEDNKDIKTYIAYKTFANIAYELGVEYTITGDIATDTVNIIKEIKAKITNDPITSFTDLFLNKNKLENKNYINHLSNLNAPIEYKERASKIANKMLAYAYVIYGKVNNQSVSYEIVSKEANKILEEIKKELKEVQYIPSDIFLSIINISKVDKEFGNIYFKEIINNLATYLYLKDSNIRADINTLYNNGQDFTYKTIIEAIKEEKENINQELVLEITGGSTIDINTKSSDTTAQKFSAFNLKLGKRPLEVDYQQSKIYTFTSIDRNLSYLSEKSNGKARLLITDNNIQIIFEKDVKPYEAKYIANKFLEENKDKIEITGIEHDGKIYNYKNSAVYDYKYYQALKEALDNKTITKSELERVLSYDNIIDSVASHNSIANQGETLTRLKNDRSLLDNDIETINNKIVENEKKEAETNKYGGTTFTRSKSTFYKDRTIENIENSDLTIGFATDFSTAGEKLTKDEATKRGKYVSVDLKNNPLTDERIKNDVSNIIKALKEKGFGDKLNNLNLNIAGNGIYTLNDSNISQEMADEIVYRYIKEFQNQGVNIVSIRSGGQTGIDESGAKAGQRLGIDTEVHTTSNYKYRNKDGNDIANEVLFKKRFEIKNQTSNNINTNTNINNTQRTISNNNTNKNTNNNTTNTNQVNNENNSKTEFLPVKGKGKYEDKVIENITQTDFTLSFDNLSTNREFLKLKNQAEEQGKNITIDIGSLSKETIKNVVKQIINHIKNKNPNKLNNLNLNIIGNHQDNLFSNDMSQETIDYIVYEYLKELQNQGVKINSIRNTGRTPFELAAIKAGERLGIKTIVNTSSYSFRDEKGNFVQGKEAFHNRFTQQGQTLTNEQTQYNFDEVYDKGERVDVDSIVRQLEVALAGASKEFRDMAIKAIKEGLIRANDAIKIYNDYTNNTEGGVFLADNNSHRSVIVLNNVTNNSTLLHELWHAVTYWAERCPTPEARIILNELNELRQLAMQDLINNPDKQKELGINSQEDFDYIFHNYANNSKENGFNLQEFTGFFWSNEKTFRYLTTLKKENPQRFLRKLMGYMGRLIKAIIMFDRTYLSSSYTPTKLMNLMRDLSKYNNPHKQPRSLLTAWEKIREKGNEKIYNGIMRIFNLATPTTPEEYIRVQKEVAKNVMKYNVFALFHPMMLFSDPHRKVIFEFYPEIIKALDLPFTNELTNLAMDFNLLIKGKNSLKEQKRLANNFTNRKVGIEGQKEREAQSASNAYKNLFEAMGVELTEELDDALGYTAMSYNLYDLFRDLNTNRIGEYQDKRSDYDMNMLKNILINANNPEALKKSIFREMNIAKKNIDMYYYNFIESKDRDKVLTFLDNMTNELAQFMAFGGVTNSGYTNIEQVIRDLFNGIKVGNKVYKMNLDPKHLKSFIANMKQYIALRSIDKALNDNNNSAYLGDFKTIGNYVNQSENHLESVVSATIMLGKMHSTLVYNTKDNNLKNKYMQGYMPNVYNDKVDVRIANTREKAEELLKLGFEQVLIDNDSITTTKRLDNRHLYRDKFRNSKHYIMRKISSVPLKSMYLTTGRHSGYHAKGLTIDELDYIEGPDRTRIVQELKDMRNNHISSLFNEKKKEKEPLIEKKEMRIIGNSSEARLHLPKKVRKALYQLDTKGSSFAYEVRKDIVDRNMRHELNNMFYDLLIESSKSYARIIEENRNNKNYQKSTKDYIPLLKLTTNEKQSDYSPMLNHIDRDILREKMRKEGLDTLYVNKYLVNEVFGEQDKNLFDYVPDRLPLLKKTVAITQKFLSSVIGEYKSTTIIRTPEVVATNAISNSSVLVAQGLTEREAVAYQIEAVSQLNSFLNHTKEATEINTRLKYLYGKGRQRTEKENEELKQLEKKYTMLSNLIKQNKALPLFKEGMYSNIIEDFETDKDDFDYMVIDRIVEKVGGSKDKSNKLNKILNEVFFTSQSSLYDISAIATRFSDFAGRYAIYYHSLSKGMSKEKAIERARETFVDYNIPTYSGMLKFLNKYGFTAFTRYWTGIQKVILHSSIRYPINSLQMIIAHGLLLPNMSPNIFADNIFNKDLPLALANLDRIDDILISLSRWNGVVKTF